MNDEDALLDQLLAEAGIVDARATPRPRRREAGTSLRLSYAQEVLWLLDRSTPGMTAYNITIARRIAGPLDRTRLQRALDTIVARHEVLRTRFPAAHGEPAPAVDPAQPVDVRFADLRGLAPSERVLRTDAIVAERSQATFDVEREHLFRATLLRCDEADHVLVLETHHLVWDGLSLGILEGELSALYAALGNGQAAALPALDLQYADYAAWQRETIAGAALEALVQYWRTALADCTEPLALPADFRRSALPSAEAIDGSIELDGTVARRVRELARAHGATAYMVMLSGYAAVLHRYTGGPNIVIGSNVATRMEVEFQHLIGYFTNTLPLRADCAGDPSFAQLLGRVRDVVLGAYDHQDVPLEALVRELHAEANLGSAPLFNVVLTSRGEAPQTLTLGEGTRVDPYGVDYRMTKFDLTLFLAETAGGLRMTLRARADLWSRPTVDRFLAHLRAVVEGAVAVPDVKLSQLTLLSPAERAALDAFNATALAGEAPSVVHLMEAAARRGPSRIAVRAGDDTLTYRELDETSNALARHLRSLGVGGGSVVGVLLERSIEAVVTIFGILKAGAAYTPLALDQPVARLAEQVQAGGADVVVTLSAHVERARGVTVVALDRDAALLARCSSEPLAHSPGREALAYVLFTSGSTGTPKPVAVTHANLAHYTRSLGRVIAGAEGGAPSADALAGWNVALTSTLAADLGNTALYAALCAGGTLHTLSPEITTDPARFAAYRTAHTLDLMKMTPSHLRALLAAAPAAGRDALLPERCLLLGGERFAWELADELRALLDARPANRCRVFNHYGPTETTVGAATFELGGTAEGAARRAGAHSVPIGRPLANVQLFVCDAYGNELPIGIPGELYIGGAGVAAGYLGHPDLTERRFVTRAGSTRTYRTGDRVRRLSTGDVEFLGRVDEQVKIRGFRVEPGEIEALLATHAEVARVAVVARAVDADEPLLVAYVEPKAASEGLRERVHAFALERLPAHMIPAAIVPLSALPMTQNGKLDRAALPEPAFSDGPPRRVEPRTALERELMALWADVLKRDSAAFGVTDNFFSLGGQSLLAIRLLGKVGRLRGVRLALRTLFDHPTIEALAATLEAHPLAAEPQAIGRATGRSALPTERAALTW